jgi:hypothetical protein
MWIYHQRSGQLENHGKVYPAYSGYGLHFMNNPGSQDVTDRGPIPRGIYQMKRATLFTHPKKQDSIIELIPKGHNALGRTKFLIHGALGGIDGDGFESSKGCIVTSPEIRYKILNSIDNLLSVEF